jgi:carbohydrate kinase (thermoresistant glucokinase family)
MPGDPSTLAHARTAAAAAPARPSGLIVMGVAGSGKSTVGEALAARLGWRFADGDDFHPPANVAKMSAGTPLTDEDRWPWLNAIAAAIQASIDRGEPMIVACSALKRRYRDVLVGGRADVRVVYLQGSRELIAERMAKRRDHFMPTALLDSQFAALEEPGDGEGAIVVPIAFSPGEMVEDVVGRLAAGEAGRLARRR